MRTTCRLFVGHIRGGVQEVAGLADLGDDDTGDPAFELPGFGPSGFEYQLIQTGAFMNEALVNSPPAFLPAFDLGGALEWDIGQLKARAVVMNIGGDGDDPGHHFYGAQFGYRLDLGMGEDNYCVAISGTNKAFDGSYHVSTVGWDQDAVREYIQAQELEDQRLDQMNLFK